SAPARRMTAYLALRVSRGVVSRGSGTTVTLCFASLPLYLIVTVYVAGGTSGPVRGRKDSTSGSSDRGCLNASRVRTQLVRFTPSFAGPLNLRMTFPDASATSM